MKDKMNLRTKVLEVKAKMGSGLSYEEAKLELEPYITEANLIGEKLAKEAKMKFKKFTFNYIMR